MRFLLKTLACLLLLVCFVQAHSVRADFIVLYNGAGLASSQPWLQFAHDGLLSGGSASQVAEAGGVRLQSDLPVSGGLGNYLPTGTLKNNLFPTLQRANGFELSFTMALTSESHTSNDRAGFSVTMLGNDGSGIELGFWANEVWAQNANPMFTHGEGISIDTTIARNYRLQVQGNNYALLSGADTLLAGSVRDYRSSGLVPYNLPNFLFLGDNTTRGASNVLLGPITLESNLSAVPEPSTLILLSSLPLASFARAFTRRIRRRKGTS